MSELYIALGRAAPLYNLVLVLVAIWLFITLFRTPKGKAFMNPWYLLFVCVLLFVLETIITILRASGKLLFIPQYTNSFFEFAIIVIFIYVVLLQKEYVKKYLGVNRKTAAMPSAKKKKARNKKSSKKKKR